MAILPVAFFANFDSEIEQDNSFGQSVVSINQNFSSMKTIIEKDAPLVTLINVITVEPEKQRQLVDALIEATEKVMNKLPGFISANFHCSLDGTKVINYAQWKSESDLQRMLQNEDAKVHVEKVAKLATKFEPTLTKVEYVDHQ